MRKSTGLLLTFMALLSVGSSQAQQANMDAKPPMAMPDMTKILTAPGVFGNFSTYKVRPDYYKLSMAERKGAAAEVVAVVEKYKDKVKAEAYLTRGFEAERLFPANPLLRHGCHPGIFG